MDRNYLAGQQGDPINAILAAAYNFSLLLKWLKVFLRLMIAALLFPPNSVSA